MINIINKEDCCGCYACNNICPKRCINMKSDEEGFWYPNINKEQCINCGLCEKVCPQLQSLEYENNIIAYAAKNKNNDKQLKSSSGGIFSLLAEYVIENQGVVFGAAFNERFEVEHYCAETEKEYIKLMGSKYVQSKIGTTYSQAKRHLDKDNLVLFSGTQCQIKGLNLFLNKEYDKLITVEVICHGVPSPKVFTKYIQEKSEKYKSNIRNISFRNKKLGWEQYIYMMEFSNMKIYEKLFLKDIYMKGFLENLYLRPSCYKCKSKNFSSGSDFSLADYWGIKDIDEGFYDANGVSLLICNSKKAKKILNKILPSIEIVNTNIHKAIEYNPCIIKPSKYNNKRAEFFKYIENDNISKYIKRYITITKYQKMKNKIIKKIRSI